ncbi:hypothetical protein A5733_20870 [Mycobacterium sp. NS-7484]|uniref:hypothetical protein n=1 Tax=Mycobacterium sp. NS-7484 TaxID=1834161 RepID=UPI00096E3BB7|nr:hypothetical protein [Mycobacterium sp. NS-7484]OMC04904.1 hypothetical protein A5733_20870 [Mycobacterium sp. NS-7484]
MAVDGLFDGAREKFAGGEISWPTADVRAVMIHEADYAVDLAAHQVLDDIPSAARVAMSDSLADKSVAAGWLSAGNISFPAIVGASCEALAFVAYTGDPATSTLIGYRSSGVANLPYTPNGSSVTIIREASAPGFFRL